MYTSLQLVSSGLASSNQCVRSSRSDALRPLSCMAPMTSVEEDDVRGVSGTYETLVEKDIRIVSDEGHGHHQASPPLSPAMDRHEKRDEEVNVHEWTRVSSERDIKDGIQRLQERHEKLMLQAKHEDLDVETEDTCLRNMHNDGDRGELQELGTTRDTWNPFLPHYGACQPRNDDCAPSSPVEHNHCHLRVASITSPEENENGSDVSSANDEDLTFLSFKEPHEVPVAESAGSLVPASLQTQSTLLPASKHTTKHTSPHVFIDDVAGQEEWMRCAHT